MGNLLFIIQQRQDWTQSIPVEYWDKCKLNMPSCKKVKSLEVPLPLVRVKQEHDLIDVH
ncbi:hypothetical protein HOLleu_22550 [Holothuria leucospilota]|uniref:Uncharacterized protein n=1 Tax=Holothuria leucospilota TaxID=206669 RepID=A0A9Q1H4P9_HOLLE|nr:hypothetical protein HOLleu_22550 [Holothuria leucospilota]